MMTINNRYSNISNSYYFSLDAFACTSFADIGIGVSDNLPTGKMLEFTDTYLFGRTAIINNPIPIFIVGRVGFSFRSDREFNYYEYFDLPYGSLWYTPDGKKYNILIKAPSTIYLYSSIGFQVKCDNVLFELLYSYNESEIKYDLYGVKQYNISDILNQVYKVNENRITFSVGLEF